MAHANIEKGKAGEDMALGVLKKNGYRIIERNYRCRYGEIDIIAKDGDTIVFVEVKTRSSSSFGPPKASVDHRKQRHIIKAATEYLARCGLTDRDARFDVVGIELKGGEGGGYSSELVKNAFEAFE